ncbi:hypothetical protein [Paractinoplanes durhamensis]|uniref:Uncharacterized protein n=1 Tax=Paractinoplanes durhamensis TaxID=113563 RepID=A0ABQ3YZ39_9ACTN|nr:hypothetical protein [Actinoplanes durhamensis]GIE02843.1 hypothetical protein Adu01nite_41930 [Actinoplanes durhamensis]
MKFFSNEAKENEPGYDRSDVATSEHAVPQQRAGSPWNDTPGDPAPDYRSDNAENAENGDNPDGELADRERRDGTDEYTDERSDESVTTTYGPDGSVTTSDESIDDAVRPEDDTLRTEDDTLRAEDDTDKDEALKNEGTFDSPEAVEPTTGETLEDSADRNSDHLDSDDLDSDDLDSDDDRDGDGVPDSVEAHTDESESDKDDDEVDLPLAEPVAEESVVEDERTDEVNGAPVAVDTEPVPALVTPVESDSDVSEDEAEATPVVAAVPVAAAAATPGSVPEPTVDRLFADGDSFAERFREIQLRFVDSPKEAADDAAVLVGEAVDRLTAALNSQKDSLGGDSDDTEQQRVRLRGYRDLLNRLTSL